MRNISIIYRVKPKIGFVATSLYRATHHLSRERSSHRTWSLLDEKEKKTTLVFAMTETWAFVCYISITCIINDEMRKGSSELYIYFFFRHQCRAATFGHSNGESRPDRLRKNEQKSREKMACGQSYRNGARNNITAERCSSSPNSLLGSCTKKKTNIYMYSNRTEYGYFFC